MVPVGCIRSQGVFMVQGEMYLVIVGGCTWYHRGLYLVARGCTRSRGVYMVQGERYLLTGYGYTVLFRMLDIG